MPEFRQKKTAEQMENSSPNPSFSICDIRIQKQMSRSFGKSFPQKIVLPKLRPHCSATCPNTWRAEPRKKNTLSFFKRNFTPAKSEMQGVFFLSGFPPSPRGGWRGVLRAYDLGQSHHALRACAVSRYHRGCFQNTFELCTMNTANFRKGFLNQKYGRREAPSVLHSPHKILILQGFATLRVAPRLPIQNYD